MGNTEYAYVLRIKEPPTLRLAIGTAGHAAIEDDLRHKIETGVDAPLEKALDRFRDSFEEESYGAEDTPKETKGEALDSGIRSVTVWHQKVAPSIEPLMVEEPVQFSLNGTPISGTIDVVRKAPKWSVWTPDEIIGDWKFVGKKPSDGGTYLLNMVGYAIGYRQKTGKVEAGLVLDHMVRTKEPYHLPISSNGPVPDESIVAYAGIVGDVVKGIEAGSFPPNGLQGNACSWCGYRDRCPAYRAASI